MGKRREWTEKETQEAIQLYKNGESYKTISEILETPRSTVTYRLKSLGVVKSCKKIKKDYLYEVGEVVNKTLKIVKQIRMKKGKETQKGYIVQSLIYPTAPIYEINEYSLKGGTGCAYKAGRKIFEENSLWSVENIRDNIIDIEEAKTISPHFNKKILFKCSNCDNTKKIYVSNLTRCGYSCPNCSIGRSYPERFFTSYLNQYSIEHEYQVKFNDLKGYIYDYKIILNGETYLIETHGLQHYSIGHNWYDATHESDEIKKEYAKENSINYIELDCRKSEFEFIKEQVNNNKHLPNINKEDEQKIKNSIETSSKYNTKEIVKFYTIDKLSTHEIAKKYNLSHTYIGNILTQNNVKLRNSGNSKRTIKCVETDEIYSSIQEVVERFGIAQGNISACCRGRRKKAGGYTWKYENGID